MAQRKTVSIDRGIFLVRYGSAEDGARPPTVAVSIDPADEQNVDLILHPDCDEPALAQPGSCMVVRSTAPATLVVEVRPFEPGGSVAASVKVEPLPYAMPAGRPSRPVTGAPKVSHLGEMRILGHVAGIGDVVVGLNEWIAGPAAPSRIEGLALDWPQKPDDLDVRYSVKLARPQATPARMMGIGSFAGTRGQAMPLTGVVFELTGQDSAAFDLSVEGAFLGSPPMRVTGKRVVLSGPTGREPLVGIRFNLARLADAPAVKKTPPQPAKTTRSSSRVRVFRSRAKEEQPMD